MTTGQMWWLIVGSCYIGAIASYIGLREIGFWRHRRRVARLGAEVAVAQAAELCGRRPACLGALGPERNVP